jgi:hypothetical protein
MSKKSFVLLAQGLLLWALVLSCSFPLGGQTENEKTYLFLIDIKDVQCVVCLDHIDAALGLIKKENPINIMAIVVCDASAGRSERNKRIITRHIEGFKVRHNISFPLFVDYDGCFASLAAKGVSIFELNPESQEIEKIDFKRRR